MIPYIESQYTAEYIANVLWKQRIAQVSSIVLIPYLKNTSVVHTAYITIASWCDSEIAYNFIQRLKDGSKETRIVHNSDEWWSIHINTHNSGNIFLCNYSTIFPSNYFERDETQCKQIDLKDIQDLVKEEIREQEMLDRAVSRSHNVTLRAHQVAFNI
jgi:hypothetical protein